MKWKNLATKLPPPPLLFCFYPHWKFFLQFFKNVKQHPINIKTIQHWPHDMVYVPAKFRENTAMRFWVTVRKLNVTDGGTEGWHFNISHLGPLARQVDNNGTQGGGWGPILSGPPCQEIWIYWMFYDHFSARSLLAKLGRWGWWWGWLERKARRQ